MYMCGHFIGCKWRTFDPLTPYLDGLLLGWAVSQVMSQDCFGRGGRCSLCAGEVH